MSLARNIVNGLLDFFGALCNSLSLYVVGARRQYSDVRRRDMPDAGVDFAGGAARENIATCIKTFPVDKRCHSPDNGAANNGDSNVLVASRAGRWRHCTGGVTASLGSVALRAWPGLLFNTRIIKQLEAVGCWDSIDYNVVFNFIWCILWIKYAYM